MSQCSNMHPSVINLRPDKPLFPLGKLVATRGAVDLLRIHELSPFDLVTRHWEGDWGDLDEEDTKANQYALRHGLRLLSSYVIGGSAKLWIITEADRSATTLLLPEEY